MSGPPPNRVLVDEGVTPAALQVVLEKLGLDAGLVERVARGSSDAAILQHQITATTLLVTSDRVLHNQALETGFQSCCIVDNHITQQRVRRLETKAVRLPQLKSFRESAAGGSAELDPSSNLRSAVLPQGTKALRSLRTLRRRIRSYFGDMANIARVEVMSCSRRISGKETIGLSVRVHARDTIASLDATERFVREISPARPTDLLLHYYALVLVLQMGLHKHRVVVRVPPGTMLPDKALARASAPLRQVFPKIRALFPDVEFHPHAPRRIETLHANIARHCHAVPSDVVACDLRTVLPRFEALCAAEAQHLRGAANEADEDPNPINS